MNCIEKCSLILQCLNVAESEGKVINMLQAQSAIDHAEDVIDDTFTRLVTSSHDAPGLAVLSEDKAARESRHSNISFQLASAEATISYTHKAMEAALKRCNDRGPRRKLGVIITRLTCSVK